MSSACKPHHVGVAEEFVVLILHILLRYNIRYTYLGKWLEENMCYVCMLLLYPLPVCVLALLHSYGSMISLSFSFQKIRDKKYKDCLYILIHHLCLDEVAIISLLPLRSESLLGWM